MINSDCPFFDYNPNTGELTIEIRRGDKVTGEVVARVNLGKLTDVVDDLQRTLKVGF